MAVADDQLRTCLARVGCRELDLATVGAAPAEALTRSYVRPCTADGVLAAVGLCERELRLAAGRQACSPAALELLGLLRSLGMDEVAAPRAEAILAKTKGDTQAALDHICKHPATSASHTGHINNGGVTWDETLGKFRAARHCDQLSDSLVRRAVYGPWPSCTTISLLKI